MENCENKVENLQKRLPWHPFFQNIVAYVIYEPMLNAHVKFKQSLPSRFVAIHKRKIKTFSY